MNRQFETSVFRNEIYTEEFVEDYHKLNFENSTSYPIRMSANEFNAYIEDRIIIHRNLLLNIGVRTTVFHNVDYLDYDFQRKK